VTVSLGHLTSVVEVFVTVTGGGGEGTREEHARDTLAAGHEHKREGVGLHCC
jgi:hypothetical protein